MKLRTEGPLLLSYGSVVVARTPTSDERDALARGVIPWSGVRSVSNPRGRTHYFPSCRRNTTLARTTQDTTCRVCLLGRAKQLRGLRWTLDANADEVAYLTSMLGERVAAFGEPQAGDDALASLLGLAPYDLQKKET